MAKQVVVLCDYCGKSGDDIRTYVISTDGERWSVDLDEQHAEILLKLARKGTAVETGTSRSSARHLEHRIRNQPK